MKYSLLLSLALVVALPVFGGGNEGGEGGASEGTASGGSKISRTIASIPEVDEKLVEEDLLKAANKCLKNLESNVKFESVADAKTKIQKEVATSLTKVKVKDAKTIVADDCLYFADQTDNAQLKALFIKAPKLDSLERVPASESSSSSR